MGTISIAVTRADPEHRASVGAISGLRALRFETAPPVAERIWQVERAADPRRLRAASSEVHGPHWRAWLGAILVHGALALAGAAFALASRPPVPLAEDAIVVTLAFEPPPAEPEPSPAAAAAVEMPAPLVADPPAEPPPALAAVDEPPSREVPEPAAAMPEPEPVPPPPTEVPEAVAAVPAAPEPAPPPAAVEEPRESETPPPVRPKPKPKPTRIVMAAPTPETPILARAAGQESAPHADAPASPAPAAAPTTAPLLAAVPVIPPRPVAGVAGNRKPDYPVEARSRRQQGRVLLRVQVSAEGGAVAVDIVASSGHAVLDQSAVAAVRGWRFTPATQAGIPVAAPVDVPIDFRMDD